MSTSGSFTPPSQTACVIPTDRTGLLVLRAGGDLDIQCHYVIPGPTIGTPGNTSPTVIEMHAVAPDELSTLVTVNTEFTGADAWPGGYDIDLGPEGSIFRLADDFNNVVSDSDISAPTVHTQFPWHARGNSLRDNTVDDSTLTGWTTALAAGVVIFNNQLSDSGINLTGVAAGSFIRNRVVGTTVDVHAPDIAFSSNDLRNSFVTHDGTGAGMFTFQSNVVFSTPAFVTVDAATTSEITMNNNVISGPAGSYRVSVEGASGVLNVSGNRLFGQNGGGTPELRIRNSGNVTVVANEIGAGTTDINTTDAVSISGSDFTDPVVTITTGTTFDDVRALDSTVTVSGAAGSTLRDVDMVASTLNLSGPGTVDGGRMTKSTLTNAGFGVAAFELLNATKTSTAAQTGAMSTPAFDNWV